MLAANQGCSLPRGWGRGPGLYPTCVPGQRPGQRPGLSCSPEWICRLCTKPREYQINGLCTIGRIYQPTECRNPRAYHPGECRSTRSHPAWSKRPSMELEKGPAYLSTYQYVEHFGSGILSYPHLQLL